MKQILLTILLLMMWLLPVVSQNLSLEVLATSGDHTDGVQASLSWTVGELAIETHSSGTSFLTQGFHQSDIITTTVTEHELLAFEVYPNPTAEVIYIQLPEDRAGQYYLNLVDHYGKQLHRNKLILQGKEFSLLEYPAASYFLYITDEKGSICGTAKILKIH